MNVFLDLKMNLAIKFRNRVMNLEILPEKAITGESLVIETNVLKKLQNELQKKKKIYLFDTTFTKKECLFVFLHMIAKKFQSQ